MFIDICTSLPDVKYFFYDFFFIQYIRNNLICRLGQSLQFFIILISVSLKNTFYFIFYFRQLDALPYAKEGTLDQVLDELYSKEE